MFKREFFVELLFKTMAFLAVVGLGSVFLAISAWLIIPFMSYNSLVAFSVFVVLISWLMSQIYINVIRIINEEIGSYIESNNQQASNET